MLKKVEGSTSMSSATNKQDMSMDDILASIRSYVSEGQNLPKSEATATSSNTNNVIQLTDEIIAIETITLQPSITPLPPASNHVMDPLQNTMYSQSKSAQDPFNLSQGNPFNRLASEISASVVPPHTLSADDLLNQLASPLIKSWLDQNLRKIVEETVQKEIDRMQRG